MKPAMRVLSFVRRPDKNAVTIVVVVALIVALVSTGAGAVAACHAPRGKTAPAAGGALARDLRVEIAQAEAQREQGVARLLVLANQLQGEARWLAVRGLGRAGGARAIQGLRALLQSADALTVAQAASGLGLVAALDQLPPDQADAISNELLRASLRVGPR
ncbi:MAG: hypothetical protein KBG15_23200, partial [Kofleriaceae bacterium]|nr:hypothetical protein [Kofleriaceae bacterium]